MLRPTSPGLERLLQVYGVRDLLGVAGLASCARRPAETAVFVRSKLCPS